MIVSGSTASIHHLPAGTRKAINASPGEFGERIVDVTTRGEAGACVTLCPSSEVRQRFLRRREEAVQGAAMLGPVPAERAAESDAAVHPRRAAALRAVNKISGRACVPGRRRDRAPADEAGIKKAKPSIGLPPQESAYGPSSQGVRPMNRLRRTPELNARSMGFWSGGGCVRSVYAPEPPLCICSRAGR